MKKVFFLKAGTAYGYGYIAGETGLVIAEDFADQKLEGKVIKKGLESLGVCRLATKDEADVYDALVAAEKESKK
jgi:hypothetical protein